VPAEESGAGRLAALFAAGRERRRAVLLPYLTAGLPDVETSVALFAAAARAGADGFEIGFPYADPLMDGPTIQEAGFRALAAGMDLDRGFDVVSRVAALGKPAIVMTYTNPVLHVGPDEFCRRVAAAGGAGLIVADLSTEESAPFLEAAARHGLGMALFVAPTTDAGRLQRVADAGPAFVYGVAEMGVTGERSRSGERIAELAERVRSVTDLPLVLGVGISTPEQAAAAGRLADGIIVGSALVRRILDAPTPAEAITAIAAAVADLATALAAPPPSDD
jgi:tryptophan synthase alpha chain